MPFSNSLSSFTSFCIHVKRTTACIYIMPQVHIITIPPKCLNYYSSLCASSLLQLYVFHLSVSAGLFNLLRLIPEHRNRTRVEKLVCEHYYGCIEPLKMARRHVTCLWQYLCNLTVSTLSSSQPESRGAGQTPRGSRGD